MQRVDPVKQLKHCVPHRLVEPLYLAQQFLEPVKQWTEGGEFALLSPGWDEGVNHRWCGPW